MASLSAIARSVENFFVPVHKEGYIFISIALCLTGVGFAVEGELGLILLVLSCWVAYFFRDPKRVTPDLPGVIVSPADGHVCDIRKAYPPRELGLPEEERWRVAVFLNVCDVHVNRYPCAGKVIRTEYHPGKFLSADLDKSSEDNERNSIVIERPDGGTLVCVQIAGLVARRIVSDAKEGDEAAAGARYGIIRFGSRAEIFLPVGVVPSVCLGQYMIGGETVIADLTKTADAELIAGIAH